MVAKALKLLPFSPSLHGRHCREHSDPVRAGKESQPLAESAHCTEHCAPDTLGDQGSTNVKAVLMRTVLAM